jgi:archaellum component FlaC
MTDEDRQRQMDFILESQAQFAANMGQMQEQVGQMQVSISELTEAQKRTEATVERLATQVEQIARQQVHINEVVAIIAESQQHTDERLNALIDIIREGRNGGS